MSNETIINIEKITNIISESCFIGHLIIGLVDISNAKSCRVK